MKKSILFMLFFLCFSTSVFGQMTVSGRVIDKKDGGLPGTSIGIKGTETGTMTDINGNFEIMVETENKITTHLLESSTGFKYFGIMYGLGNQQFEKEGLENNTRKNWGANIGIAKRIKYIGLLYFKSFYWQDYWAWEANLNKSIYYKKLRLNTAISYRQTTQDFKEVNLTLGYIF
ncbi:carboxypeptidase-like regulatory domain-containing protein [Bernardetia sp. ABR2-2B]|uniref:carboxypeptidase-like regulatory domain-containing protein n=1 Tax=Bernardetia sp. ABR2-2B TaxID=3127472 RepID=UPI0030CE63BB